MSKEINRGFGIIPAFVVVVVILACLPSIIKSGKANQVIAAQKPAEVIGQVVGGPQIVAGSPSIGYVVYIAESNTWGALHAKGSPSNLSNGARVVMYQRDKLSEWYTFLRYAQ